MQIYGHELKDSLVMEIGKFTILWNCFERDDCHYNCNPKTIESVAPSILIDQEKRRELANVFQERSKLFKQITHEYVESGLNPENSKGSKDIDKEYMVEFIEQNGEHQTAGCLLAINRIRNNLVHGLKLITELNGQFRLFQAVNAVLESMSRK